MDSCQRFKEMVSDYIEGGLGQQDKAMMDKHLKDCLRCRGVIKQLKSLIHTVRELPRVKVSTNFETILRARISMESGLERRRRARLFPLGQIKFPAYAFSAVMIVVALVASLLLIKPETNEAPIANIDNELYKQSGPVRVDPTTNEKFIFFIEKQPVPIINPQPEIMDENDNLINSNIRSDSVQVQDIEKEWLKTVKAFEPNLL